MGSLGTSLLAWLLFPAAAYVLFVGVGLLAERASGDSLPRPLLAPVGMAATVVLVMPLFWTGAGAWLATPVWRSSLRWRASSSPAVRARGG